MRQFLIIFLSIVTLGIIPSLVWSAQNPVKTTLIEDINSQNQAFAGESGANLSAADPRLVAAQIIKILLSVTGTMFVCWAFYGAYLIFISAGDSEKVEHAKSIITSGTIGILIVLMSYGITTFLYNMWKKTSEDPDAGKIQFYQEPDTDFYNKDPLQQNTNLP